MPRSLRFEYAGAVYHGINRGNYRNWIFESEGSKDSFQKCLFEACERAGWILHAYCIMGNHYHLALETPEPNLSVGMKWLQGVFAARYNRFRKERGALFQGRFKSILLEEGSPGRAVLLHSSESDPGKDMQRSRIEGLSVQQLLEFAAAPEPSPGHGLVDGTRRRRRAI